MSTEERQNYVSLVTTMLVSIPYFAFIYLKYLSTNLTPSTELTFWATAILLLIPLRVVIEIIITIVAIILGTIFTAIITGKEPKEPKDITDERDQLIDLKGNRNSYYGFVFGFLIAVIVLALGASASVFFSILLVTGFISELVDTTSKIYYYHKGV